METGKAFEGNNVWPPLEMFFRFDTPFLFAQQTLPLSLDNSYLR